MAIMLRQKLSGIQYLICAALLHLVILAVLIVSYELSRPLVVFENTNKVDIISAVVLGDTSESKLIVNHSSPQKAPVLNQETVKSLPSAKPIEKEKAPPQNTANKEVIPLKTDIKKNIVKNKKDEVAKALMADIKHKSKQAQKTSHDKKIKTALKAKQDATRRFDKLLKEQAERSLREQLLNEQIQLNNQMSRKAQGIINKYEALIKQTISSHWIVPAGVNKRLHCKLNIRLAPGGMVLDAQVTQSSGDLALDHSARAAVFNASPLPVPSDPKLFDQFRIFEMDVSPKDIITVGNIG